MDSKRKGNSIITTELPSPTDTFEVSVMLPKTIRYNVLGQGSLDFDLTAVSEANIGWAVIHGFGQRIPDAAAIGQADRDGVPIPKAERTALKFSKMRDVISHYESGTEEWERKGAGGGGVSDVLLAITRVSNCDMEEAKRKAKVHADMHFAGDERKALAHLATGKRVKAMLETIRDERLSRQLNGVELPDADEMLDEIDEADADGEKE